MIVVSLELVRYKRMLKNNIEVFTFKPTENIQVILGTNGCGKSSLLWELFPLPGDSDNFTKDGSKTIKLTNRNNIYTLTNNFALSKPHSFIKNGEELNPGGTITTQRELAMKEFGVNEEIRNLLLDKEKFHSMKAPRRREWFTMLSDVKYDYAMEVFGRLKSKASEINGALKHAKKRLVSETGKIVSTEEESQLRREVEITYKELRLLTEQSAPLDNPLQYYEDRQQRGLAELHQLSTKLLRMRTVANCGVYPYGMNLTKKERDEWGVVRHLEFRTLEDIDEAVNSFRLKIAAEQALINKEIEEHSKISDTIDILTKTGEEGVQSLKENLNVIRENIRETLRQRKLQIEGMDPVNGVSALEGVYDTLFDIFSTIPENDDRRYTQAKLREHQINLAEKKENRAKVAKTLAQYVEQKNHAEAHKNNGNISCPNCNHKWIIGYSEEKHGKLLDDISLTEEQIKKIDISIEGIEEHITLCINYGAKYREFTNCVNHWPILKPFWDFLVEDSVVIRSPRKAIALLDNFRFDMGLEAKAHELHLQAEEIKKLIESAEKIGDTNLAEQKEQLQKYSLSISNRTETVATLQTDLNNSIQYKRHLSEAIDLGEQIKVLIKDVTQINEDRIEMLRRSTLNHCVDQLHHVLAVKQKTLNDVVIQKKIVEDLEQQVEQLTLDDEAVKMLVKELSPTEGLIADGLLGFIKSHVGQMNSLIKKIWSYPLQIHNCGTEDEFGASLNYKFPLMVQTKTNVLKDVDEGSTGIQEIVDLAFKIAAMQPLGLSEFPLFFDEAGASFDNEHRNVLAATIKELMETKSFTQLFLVNHYSSMYGIFTNAEFCVIDPSNIMVPEVYNEHVTIS
jgi:hypothetical protein